MRTSLQRSRRRSGVLGARLAVVATASALGLSAMSAAPATAATPSPDGTSAGCLSDTMSGDLFVTLNPLNEISPAHVIREMSYAHPVFNRAAIEAQRSLWELQGRRRTWFCGSYFGYGFHEDGLQAGLAVAEELGGIRRPWTVRDQSARIHAPPPGSRLRPRLLEAAE